MIDHLSGLPSTDAIGSVENERHYLGLVVEQQVEVVKALIDDVLVESPLVLDDYWAPVLIDPQSVNASPVRLVCLVFTREETDAEKGVQVTLDQVLQ
jgi:hypothetical protein